MEFERKTGVIGAIGIILLLFTMILADFGIYLPDFISLGIKIVAAIFITIFVIESFIVFFKNVDKYK